MRLLAATAARHANPRWESLTPWVPVRLNQLGKGLL
jgi:hypothetical protein